MIVCLVGTNPYSFDRLVKEVDKLGKKYDIFIQLGNTNYIPKNCKYQKFLDNDKLLELVKQADLVITQGGFGSITEALKLEKKVIAVPRKPKFNESIDEQEELVRYFEEKGYIVGCYNICDLENLVNKCLNNEVVLTKYKPETNIRIKDKILEFIDEN